MITGIAAGALGGALLAAAFLGSVWYSAGRATSGDGRLRPLILGPLARVSLVGGGFLVLARWGGPATVTTAFITFLVVRGAVVWRVHATGNGPT